MKYFFKFTKFGWVTLGITTLVFILGNLFLWVFLSFFKFNNSTDLIIIIRFFQIILLGASLYHWYLGIIRIFSYKTKLRHYKNLKHIMNYRQSYDPQLEAYLTTTCDKTVLKELQKEFKPNCHHDE